MAFEAWQFAPGVARQHRKMGIMRHGPARASSTAECLVPRPATASAWCPRAVVQLTRVPAPSCLGGCQPVSVSSYARISVRLCASRQSDRCAMAVLAEVFDDSIAAQRELIQESKSFFPFGW